MQKKVLLYVCILVIICGSQPGLGLAQGQRQKALMIIASYNFRDEELLLPKDALETNGVEVFLASSVLSPVRGMLGTVVKPQILVTEVNVEDYDAIIFVGGSGAREFWDDATAQHIAVEAQAAKKVLAAICFAPVTLARAGVLKDKKATAWRGLGRELKITGAQYTGKQLEISGNIITADGPEAAHKFADALVKTLIRRR